MNTRRFQKVSRVIQYFFLIIVGIWCAIILLGITSLLFNSNNSTFEVDLDAINNSFFVAQHHQLNIEAEEKTAASIVGLLSLGVGSYLLYLGSNIFRDLADGETPFTNKQVHRLKTIAKGFLFITLFSSLIYSFILSLLIKNGYSIRIGFDSNLLFSLILYCIAEVFQYGVSLQTLSDETL